MRSPRRRTNQKMARPRLMRSRRLRRQSRSQRRRRLRPSSIPPVHPFNPPFFPDQSDLFFPLPVHPPTPVPCFPAGSEPQTVPSHYKQPEKYFYQQFCKYWFRFLAQKRQRERRGSSELSPTRAMRKGGALSSFFFSLFSF